jgi:hypothetical protein
MPSEFFGTDFRKAENWNERQKIGEFFVKHLTLKRLPDS